MLNQHVTKTKQKTWGWNQSLVIQVFCNLKGTWKTKNLKSSLHGGLWERKERKASTDCQPTISLEQYQSRFSWINKTDKRSQITERTKWDFVKSIGAREERQSCSHQRKVKQHKQN